MRKENESDRIQQCHPVNRDISITGTISVVAYKLLSKDYKPKKITDKKNNG